MLIPGISRRGLLKAAGCGAASLKQVSGVKVIEEENVPETDAVAKTMKSTINLDGAGLILATRILAIP
jgi:basic membrane protein A